MISSSKESLRICLMQPTDFIILEDSMFPIILDHFTGRHRQFNTMIPLIFEIILCIFPQSLPANSPNLYHFTLFWSCITISNEIVWISILTIELLIYAPGYPISENMIFWHFLHMISLTESFNSLPLEGISSSRYFTPCYEEFHDCSMVCRQLRTTKFPPTWPTRNFRQEKI